MWDTSCIFKKVTGLYCPGCGGTRAIKALLTGHPIISFLYNPIVIIMILILGLYIIRFAKAKVRAVPTGQALIDAMLPLPVFVVFIVVIIANAVIRNIMLLMGTDPFVMIMEILPG